MMVNTRVFTIEFLGQRLRLLQSEQLGAFSSSTIYCRLPLNDVRPAHDTLSLIQLRVDGSGAKPRIAPNRAMKIQAAPNRSASAMSLIDTAAPAITIAR